MSNKKDLLFIAIAVLLRVAPEPGASLSYMAISFYALFGRSQAIQALVLSWFLTMINPGLAPEASYGSVLRFVVIIAATVSVFLRSKLIFHFKLSKGITSSTVLLGIFFVGHSFLFSPMFGVSLLKALSWTVLMSTLLAAWGGLSYKERDSLIWQIFVGLVVLLLISLPLLSEPSLGFLRNGRGFQGIFNHPQVFGVTVALLGAWATSRLFTEKRPQWASLGLVTVCLYVIILSQTRTAGLSMVFGTGIAILIAPLLAGKRILAVLPGLKSKRMYFILGLALVGLLTASPLLNQVSKSYIAKGTRTNSVVEAYEISRGSRIEQMWYNIQEKPLQGIGFGIASTPSLMNVEYDPVFHLPISASVEKGVMPLAVIEELGILGFLAVAIWIWAILRRSAYSGVEQLAVVMTALLLNLGESILFSPGGMGMLVLVLMGWAGSKTAPVR